MLLFHIVSLDLLCGTNYSSLLATSNQVFFTKNGICFQLFFLTSCHTDSIDISFSDNALKVAVNGKSGVRGIGVDK